MSALTVRAVAEPLATASASETPQGTAEPMRPRDRSGETKKLLEALVMMVDDEPLNIEVTQIHLEEAGYTRFVSTSNPLEALDLVVEHRPDVLLLDLMMPGMSGLEILAHME